jgi:hypothetical protein
MMKNRHFDEQLPEETEEMQQMLQSALPSVLKADDQQAMLERVSARLQEHLQNPENESNLRQGAAPLPIRPLKAHPPQRMRRFWAAVAAIVLVSLVSGLTFISRTYTDRTIPLAGENPFITDPYTVSSRAGSLDVTMSITRGPHFVSELLAVEITLKNNGQTDYPLAGTDTINLCTSAFGVVINTITDAATPATSVSYDFPIHWDAMKCPAPSPNPLKPGEQITARGYFPLTASGNVVLAVRLNASSRTNSLLPSNAPASSSQSSAEISTPIFPAPDQSNISVLANDQSQVDLSRLQLASLFSPLAGNPVSMLIKVSPDIPDDRKITLTQQGEDVQVVAPEAIRGQLLSAFYVSCAHSFGIGNWEKLSSSTLHKPDCDDAKREWTYVVAAPGYAIASIKMHT